MRRVQTQREVATSERARGGCGVTARSEGWRPWAALLPVALMASTAIVALAAPPPSAWAQGPKSARRVEHATVTDALRRRDWPRPARRRADAVERNAECVACHADVAAEWGGSQHSSAFTDGAFLEAFEREPLAFCRSCHAPESEPRLGLEQDARALIGVSCVTCHDGPNGVLAGPQRGTPGHGLEPSPHAIERTAEFTAVTACAACHEFTFPDQALRAERELMQSTVSEHASSPTSDRSCGDCHMPSKQRTGRLGRDHRFLGSRDVEFVRSAVRIEARRLSAHEVEVSLTPSGVGHAFPTGDLFRRLSVEARDERGRSRKIAYLAREFDERPVAPGVLGRKQVADQRVAPDAPKRVRFRLADLPASESVQWSVRYERVDHPRGKDPTRAAVLGSIELASGRLSPFAATPPTAMPTPRAPEEKSP